MPRVGQLVGVDAEGVLPVRDDRVALAGHGDVLTDRHGQRAGDGRGHAGGERRYPHPTRPERLGRMRRVLRKHRRPTHLLLRVLRIVSPGDFLGETAMLTIVKDGGLVRLGPARTVEILDPDGLRAFHG